ncbi:diacylglycerol/lipid kinase family protein [Acidomonas methanolica]|uniref:diacylglycerol/lipid kinase family protein n=1 Tax=Acidomonas methanolica TaxID=437 RepID=UPI0009DE1B12|nr:diacylglycerol kinase family protein [Acidomonas methanolica]MBU2654518.1 acylglycerol kinase family protein [Acidomonas methanolica]
MTVALIHNPRSRRNRHTGSAFVSEASQLLGRDFLLPTSHDELDRRVGELARRGVDLIVVDGGDGTVSDVLTAIHRAYPADALPRVAVFPSGNSNLIAGDVGLRRRGMEALRRIVSAPETFVPIRRRPLRISWSDGSQPERLGMFHGSTGFARAIAIAHSPHVLRYAPHGFAVAATLIGAVGGLALKSRRSIWLNGDAVDIRAGEDVLPHERSFLFLATGLQHLDHGIWPFWRRPGDPVQGVHFLEIAARPRRLAPAMLALLRGRAPDWLRAHPDYRSGCVDEITLRSRSDFVLDGEELSPGPGGSIVVGRGPVFTFLQG